ncbi:MFS transporter [Streptomyces sp. NBC_00557]|uniref:MFS transporter n=1 Tax=Streptomyces sp. NBC_00557 TaxID=2975776 RepID=UPI002E820563|nr:MFS transporter [Streptomyces sp. NBC_00557]WUC39493.1 MFS transporter [Streptomyces sp. NBC_00557]
MGVDAVGTGLFLPVSVLYPMRVLGLSEAVTGTVLTIATCLTLALPALVSVWIGRVGPRRLVVAGLLLQAVAMTAYLCAGGPLSVFAVVLCAVTGQRVFFASVYGMLADLAPSGSRDGYFAWAATMQSGGTALGGLLSGALFIGGDPSSYRLAVGGDGLTFALSALLVLLFVRAPEPVPGNAEGTGTALARVLADRPFLGLTAANTLLVLPIPATSTLLPAFVVGHLGAPAWLPGALTGGATALLTVCRPAAVRALARINRVRVLQTVAALLAVWAAAMGAAVLMATASVVPYLFAVTGLFGLAFLVQGPVSNGLVAAVAPEPHRSGYLAVSQYSFGVADAAAPLLVVLLTLSTWLPWAVLTCCMVVALAVLTAVSRSWPRRLLCPADPAPDADRVLVSG